MEQAPGFLHSQNLNFLMLGGISHQIVGIEALSEIAETIYGNKNDDFPQTMRASLAGSRLGY